MTNPAYRDPEYIAGRNALVNDCRIAWLEGRQVRCWICQELISSREMFTAEHRIPLSQGGTHARDNLAPAHHRCNSGKRPVPAKLKYQRPARQARPPR